MIIHADCILAMSEMEPSSIDAIVTDSPYAISFMQKEFDTFESPLAYLDFTIRWASEALRVLKPGGSLLSFGGTRTFHRLTCGLEDAGFTIKDCLMWLYGQGFPKSQDLGKMIDKRGGVNIEFNLFRDAMKEAMKTSGVTRSQLQEKLGNFMLSHYLTNSSQPAIPNYQDYLIIRDTLSMGDRFDAFFAVEAEREVVGKSNNKIHLENLGEAGYQEEWDITTSSTSLARHWDGYKIGGIKPAWEPIIWAVKKPEGAWIDNVLTYGVGAVNVDECRVEGPTWNRSTTTGDNIKGDNYRPGIKRDKWEIGEAQESHPKGRFPANLLLSHTPDCREVGTKRVKGHPEWTRSKPFAGGGFATDKRAESYADPDGYETISAWECVETCPVRLLDEQSGDLHSQDPKTRSNNRSGSFFGGNDHFNTGGFNDTGGASRFFYTSKATDRQDYNDHPTLKPTDLVEWLIRLVTRPGQTVLDPFAGSGTTGVAAIQSGREFILIEQDEHYIDICKRRTTDGAQQGMF